MVSSPVFSVVVVLGSAAPAQVAAGEVPVTLMSPVTLTVRAARRPLLSPLDAVVSAVYFIGTVPLFLMTTRPAVVFPGTIADRLRLV